MSDVHLPGLTEINSFLDMLFGARAEARSAGPASPKRFIPPHLRKKMASADTNGGAWCATYVDKDGVAAVCRCDHELAAILASALSMIPPAVAREAAASQQLTPDMKENLDEFFNICAGLFNSATTDRIVLRRVHSGEDVPDKVGALIKEARRQLVVKVELRNYGGGTMSLFAA